MDTTSVIEKATGSRRAQDERWTVRPEELEKIGAEDPGQMSLEQKVSELGDMLELAAKYPPAYGNTVNVPFMRRASELLGREITFPEATDQRARLLELAQQSSEMRQVVQNARADELRHVLQSTPAEQIGQQELSRISRLIGRAATIGDVVDGEAQESLIEQVRRGELVGSLPGDEFLSPS